MKLTSIALCITILSGAISNAVPLSILVLDSQNNSSLGGSEWGAFNALIENRFTVVDIVQDLEGPINPTYDALWINSQHPGIIRADTDPPPPPILSANERANITAFFNSGGRTVMIGEWGSFSGFSYADAWNDEILSLVGGQQGGTFGDAPLAIDPQAIQGHELTSGVNTLGLIGNSYGTAVGGTALFDPNVATVWNGKKKNANVLTILDVGVLSDERLGDGDNQAFGVNVANWIAGAKHNVPDAGNTLILFVCGLAGLALIKKR